MTRARPLTGRPEEPLARLMPLAVLAFALVAVGAALGALVLMVLMLNTMGRLDRHVAATNSRMDALRAEIEAPLGASLPLLDAGRGLISRADRQLRPLDRTLAGLPRSLGVLQRADLSGGMSAVEDMRTQLRRLAALTDSPSLRAPLQTAGRLLDRATSLDTLGTLSRDLQALPRLSAGVARLSAGVGRLGQPLAQLQPLAGGLSAMTGDLGAIQSQLGGLQDVRGQVATLEPILQAILHHVRSLDMKTGGSLGG